MKEKAEEMEDLQEEESFDGAFEDEEVASDEPESEQKEEKKKRAIPPEELLTEDTCVDGTYAHYVDYLENVAPAVLKLDPTKTYTKEEVWKQMNEVERRRANAAFKKKRPRSTVSKAQPPKSKAHARAIEIVDDIREQMKKVAEEPGNEELLQELVGLNPDDEISIEIYIKGWQKFVKGLPTD